MKNNKPETTDLVVVERLLTLRMVGRITVYYAIVAVLYVLTISIFPSVVEHLPVGGVADIADNTYSELSELETAILEGHPETAAPAGRDPDIHKGSRYETALSLVLSMFGTLILMLPVAWVYKCIHHTGEHDHSLDETAFVLPTVVAGIVVVVQHSLALAFSLAGIVAGVRFRRTLQDTFDTLFIFVAIGVGIAAGVKALDVAAVMSMFFNYATLGVCAFGDGLESHHQRDKLEQKKLNKLSKIKNSKPGAAQVADGDGANLP